MIAVKRYKKVDRCRPTAAIRRIAARCCCLAGPVDLAGPMDPAGHVDLAGPKDAKISRKAIVVYEGFVDRACGDVARAVASICSVAGSKTITERIAAAAFELVFGPSSLSQTAAPHLTTSCVSALLKRRMVRPCTRLSERASSYAARAIEGLLERALAKAGGFADADGRKRISEEDAEQSLANGRKK